MKKGVTECKQLSTEENDSLEQQIAFLFFLGCELHIMKVMYTAEIGVQEV